MWTHRSAHAAWNRTEELDRQATSAFVPVGSICSGYAGLDIGIAAAIPNTRLAWVAEYEPPTVKVPNPVQGAARILAHRFPDVPNLGDITVVPWDTTPRAKIIGGGTPCQDVSHAGARKGMRDGTRSGIWSSMVEAITHHRPTLVVWENVLGALSADADSDMEPCPVCVGDERESHLRALGRVVGDLAEIRYDTVWTVVSASSVGAPHRRERVIVLAWPAEDPDSAARDQRRIAAPGQAASRRARPDSRGSDRTAAPADAEGHGLTRAGDPRAGGAGLEDDCSHASDALRAGLAADGTGDPGPELPAARSDRVASPADPHGNGWDEGRPESAEFVGEHDAPVGGSAAPADAGRRDGEGRASQSGREAFGGTTPTGNRARPVPDAAERGDIRWGDFTGAIRRWEHTLGRVAPAPTAPTARGGMALSPAFVEWMMGLPEGWVTDPAIWTGLSKSAARNAQLKALGNGVVPQQAAAAITWLLQFAPVWVRADLGLSG